jgi:hypothetical protein
LIEPSSRLLTRPLSLITLKTLSPRKSTVGGKPSGVSSGIFWKIFRKNKYFEQYGSAPIQQAFNGVEIPGQKPFSKVCSPSLTL